MAMKVSVVVATYNGERYIQQQLKSIFGQSELPDELIVSDDGSIDDTVLILREFENASPFPMRVFVRDKPLGFASNFASASLCATGDVIVFCDQDDVWNADKISEIKTYFLANPEKELVLHDIAVCDSELHPMVASYFSYLTNQSHDPSYLVKGCATAIKRSLRDRAYPLPINGRWTHDCRVHALAHLSGTRGTIDRILCNYRVHSSNTSGYILPKNNWKGAIAARLKKRSLDQSSFEYTTLQFFSLRDISDSELEEFYSAHLRRGQLALSESQRLQSAVIFSGLKDANDLLNKRSTIARLDSLCRRLIEYFKLAANGGYVDAGGNYSFAADIMKAFGRRK